MTSPLNRIDKALKTKEDLQSFVLIAFVLFILFVKCYMMVAGPKTGAHATAQNVNVTKTTTRNI